MRGDFLHQIGRGGKLTSTTSVTPVNYSSIAGLMTCRTDAFSGHEHKSTPVS